MSHDASSSRPVDAVAERFVDEYAALDPIAATYLGLPGHEGRLTDLSSDGFAARADLTRRALADATAARPSDEREQVAKDAFLERLGLDVELDEAGVPQSQVSVLTSGLHEVRSVFDLMATEGEEAWSNIDARLAAIPATLEGYRETLVRAADAGDVAAKRQLTAVAEQVRSWTGQDGGDNFFLGLVAGREKYTLGSRHFLGVTVDLEETYAWGFEELKRIEDEMARVADKIVPGAGLDEAVAALEADPSRRIEGKEAFREWMQDLATRTLEDMAGTHFAIPEPIRRIECCIAPTNDGGIYYTGPSEDFSRPGRMWWAVPAGVESF